MKTSALFVIASGVAAVSAADCAAPGEYDSQGRYSCNPAHQYPEPNKCQDIDGCPLLVGGDGKAIIRSATTSAQPTQSATCAGPGEYDSQGRYSCNLAHQYPEPNTCKVIDGCPLLADGDGNAIISKNGTATTTTGPQPTSSCAAPGEHDSQGRYSCNPAHQYPEGQQCVEIGGCYVLCSGGDKPVPITSQGGNTGGNPTAQPTTGPPVVNGGAVLQGGLALVAAAFAAIL